MASTTSVPVTPSTGCSRAREGGLGLGARGEGRVGGGIDVRDHRDLGAKDWARAVRLVSLADEPAATRPRVAAELRDLAADQEGGVVAKSVEAERDHGGGRRLAMRAGDHDRALQGDELGEKLGARPALDLVAIRGRDHHFVPAVREDGLRRELYQRTLKRSQVGRLNPVPPAHLRAPGASQERIPGKAGPADADEP